MGYSHLMGVDEVGTLEARKERKEQRREVVDPADCRARGLCLQGDKVKPSNTTGVASGTLARGVLFFKPAFKYLSSVLSRKAVSKFDNFRDLKVREFLGEEILNLLRS